MALDRQCSITSLAGSGASRAIVVSKPSVTAANACFIAFIAGTLNLASRRANLSVNASISAAGATAAINPVSNARRASIVHPVSASQRAVGKPTAPTSRVSPATAGENSKLDLRKRELSIVGGDHDVARHRQFKATAEAPSTHHRYDGKRRIRKPTMKRGDRKRQRLGLGRIEHGQFADVGPRGECSVAYARNDKHTDVIAFRQSCDRPVQRIPQSGIESIELGRPVDSDVRDPVAGSPVRSNSLIASFSLFAACA